MNIRFAGVAQSEYVAARRHCAGISPIVEDAFVQSVRASLQLILQFPKIGFTIEPHIQRKFVHRFPFAIFYSITDNVIFILGILDLRDEPEV